MRAFPHSPARPDVSRVAFFYGYGVFSVVVVCLGMSCILSGYCGGEGEVNEQREFFVRCCIKKFSKCTVC